MGGRMADNEERLFTHAGHRCKVRKIEMGHWTGYAQTSLSGFTESDLYGHGHRLIEAHGGVTYGPDADGWVGFDTAHAGDLCLNEDGEPWGTMYVEHGREPTELRRYGSVEACERASDCNVWRLKDVREETERLAEQLSLLEGFAAAVDS